jgi:hypothetical protein
VLLSLTSLVGERWKGLSEPEDLPGVDDLLGSFRWYDALCIDQDNDLERGHQVRLMGEIYKHAWRVLAWLGTNDQVELEDEKLDVASNTPRDVPVPPFDFLYTAYQDKELYNSRYSSERKDFGMNWVIKYFLNRKLKETVEELITMCKMEYWTRLWIIQEICLASQIGLLYASRSLDWNVFQCVFDALVDADTSQYRRDDQTLSICHLLLLLMETQPWKLTQQRGLHDDSDNERTWRLADPLEISSTSYCHDKRDKIYRILGPCEDSFRRRIAIDYTCSLFDVYENALKYRWEERDDKGEDDKCTAIAQFSHLIQKALIGPHFESIDCHSMTEGRLRMLNISKGCVHEYMALSGTSDGRVHLIIPVPPELCGQDATRVQETNIEQAHTEVEDAFLWKSREWGMLWEAWGHPTILASKLIVTKNGSGRQG